MTGIERLAIVNRGEPAVRALDAVAELNRGGAEPPITTIVLYTDADAGAWFVRRADEAVSIGAATSADPADGHRRSAYLDEERIVATLLRARADAAWVGWGFVSEHASFARRCEEAGIVFVGPDSATMSMLGDKIGAKTLAEKADVPVLPWSGGPVTGAADAAAHAARLGYPVLLKAAAGGGGRGIRVVHDPADLPVALAAAQGEARLAFGDPAVFVEKLVPRARHVEVQVIADGRGTTWAVGLRDCSVQRRNQKVLEESASTVLDQAATEEIKAAAVRIAAAAGYRSAGTVEFLVDPRTGRYLFMEVNTRLQVEHPVTEATSGVDLVKLQLHIARGGALEGAPPEPAGHAIEARLCAEDPEQDFAPAPGRILLWRPATGPGIRVDTGVVEGDAVIPEFDSMIAKVVAWGRDRPEALARLRRALAESAVVIDGGTTNRSFLLTVLGRPEVTEGRFDNRWLDRLVAGAEHLPRPDPVPVLVAAAEAYETDHAADVAAFHDTARRGRPDPPEDGGRRARLRYRGRRYDMTVYRSGADTYRVRTPGGEVEFRLERGGPYERRLLLGDRLCRVVSTPQGGSFLIDVGEGTHRVWRDDGGTVRSGFPAFVLAVRVEPGDAVEEGDPLAVLESMKMESVVAAPFAGVVTAIEAAAGTQVLAGQPLVRMRRAADGPAERPGETGSTTGNVDFSPLATRSPPPASSGADRHGIYAVLRSHLLGFDVPAAALRRVLTDQRALAGDAEADEPGLRAAEDSFLHLFADISGLHRAQPEPEADDPGGDGAQEFLLSYLQWLDPDRAGLPGFFRERLATVLTHYGVTGLGRDRRLEEAVYWMYRAFRRTHELVPAALAVLERRLRNGVRPEEQAGVRALLDRLSVAAQARHGPVAELARDLRFRYFDEPLHERVLRATYAEMDRDLDALAAEPDRPDREHLLDHLVWCPQPMRGRLLGRWTTTGPDARRFRETLLEIYLRRFYRTRDLARITFEERGGLLLAAADHVHEGERHRVVTTCLPFTGLRAAATAILAAQALRAARRTVVDLVTWRSGERPDAASLAAEIAGTFAPSAFGPGLARLDVTVTSERGGSAEHSRTQHFSYRPGAGDAFAEDLLHRNLHPMIAERAEIWRLSNFALERLRSAEDVYLFRGVAHDNPADVRLFAVAEVRDLTPVRDAEGRVISLPRLERMGLQALAAIRRAMADMPERERPRSNRIVLYVRPLWDVPRDRWRDLARPFAALAAGAGLEKVLLRVRVPAGSGVRDAVLHIEGLGEHGPAVHERPVENAPIRPLTEYRRRLLRARRFGAPYPYEIIRMLAPPDGTPSDFPPGEFTEYDLHESGRLVRVNRPEGGNTANLVVGLLTNRSTGISEGMTRAVILGDPSRSLGSLAEPECRRVIGALDLAERLGVPVEWFALSSGARIAMDSGTENMDWIGAVLRRIIEFTQAGGEINIVVTGVNVGAQPYWNAEATMLMHTRGILIMVPGSAMVLTGKQALDFSGGVSAEDNTGIGGFERVMGPNGQAQYGARDLADACAILLRHYRYTYVVPGERFPRRVPTTDPAGRDVCPSPHPGPEFTSVGDVFSAEHNAERKSPFDIRAVMRAVADSDREPLERWARWRGAETTVVWDAGVGGIPVSLLGLESRVLPRRGYVPADGPPSWTSGTLFPQSSRKLARAINAASGNRPVVVLANLSGFDGSPESMRRRQLEYGAEIGRAVTNFDGPIVFVVVSRYHGGAFVVFSKRLNPRLEIAAVEGSYASVIGGAPAAAVVFVREVRARTERDPRVVAEREHSVAGDLHEVREAVRAEKLREVAAEFDRIHSVRRALRVGSVDRIIPASTLRPYIVDALERGMAADLM